MEGLRPQKTPDERTPAIGGLVGINGVGYRTKLEFQPKSLRLFDRFARRLLEQEE
jgi:hypothetical protein